MSFRSLFGPLLFALTATAAEPGSSPTPAQLEFFEKEVRPVLADNCFKCHGEKKQKSGLRLDSREFILKGGEVGPAVVSGKPELSRLIKSINHVKADDIYAMPGDDEKLPPRAIAALTEWVRQGLPWPAESKPLAQDPRKHWAFQPVANPAVPAVAASETTKINQPLDRFVLAKLKETGLDFNPQAPREVIIRRLTLALWGFNPSADEVAAYVADRDPHATEKLVDRLLAAPAFGERWARHWLDVSRYADTKGYVFREERNYAYAYTYRDWVVNAFNQDLPYDQFLRLQLAADQIVKDPENNRDLAALGFLTLGRRFLNRTPDIIDDRIDVVMRGTQGLTMACARCHDHKFDPLPTAEYYSLYAIFNSSEEPKEAPALKPFTRTKETDEFEADLGVRQKKLNEFIQSRFELSYNAEKTAAYLTLTAESLKDTKLDANQKANAANLYAAVLAGWKRALTPQLTSTNPTWGAWLQLQAAPAAEFPRRLTELLARPDAFVDPLLRARLKAKPPTKFAELTAVYATLLSDARKPDYAGLAEWKPWRDLVNYPNGPTSVTAASLIPTYNIADRNTREKLEVDVSGFKAMSPKSPPHAMVLQDKATAVKGVVFLRGSASRPGKTVPRQFPAILTDGKVTEFTQGSGRLDMANAIASKANPLTARVMANRIWTELIGRSLVETPSDYGVRTLPPKNPALLEYLAASFMKDGWSMKKLIRSIVLSRTFLQTTDVKEAALAKDPDNELSWRAQRRRLDFEAMRDSMLRAADRLETKLGGQPFDLVANFSTPRRTIYGHIDRQNLPAFFRTFDFANPDYHVPKRNQTTTPQQALWMMNHPFGRTQADALAAKVAALPTAEAQITALYRAILSRQPQPAELALSLNYLREANLAPAPALWTNGFGGWNEQSKTVAFTEMKVQTKDRIAPTDTVPAKAFAHTFLTSMGGHPGDQTNTTAVIRRWTAGSAGQYRLEGTLNVASKASDGVRARVVVNGQKLIAEIIVKGAAAAPVHVTEVALTAGQYVDFIADNFVGSNSDSFNWSPVIKDAKTGEIITSAAGEFGKKPDRQSALSTFAQVLLTSNEFIFAD